MLKSNEIIWNGPNIPCIQLCKGDTVSEVVYKIASEVCCIIDNLDVSTLSYECIIDKAKTYGNVDLFLLFQLLLNNDCKIKDLLNAKIDANDTTELLVDSLDLKCFLQPYLDELCTIIRFYNQPGAEINPNHTETVFQKSEVETTGYFYVSDIDQSVWTWDGIQYVKTNEDLNSLCVCELSDLDLDVKKTLQVIIDNICQTKSSGIIKACDDFKVVPFDTIDPNTLTTVFTGTPQEQTSYYISSITHKLWRWVSSENSYLPSILTTANINLASIDSCLLQSEIALQNWVDQYKVYQEPIIKSCLSTIRNTSNHIVNVSDAEICSLQSSVGTESDVNYSFLKGETFIVTGLNDTDCTKIVYFKGVVNSSMNFNPFPSLASNPNYFYINRDGLYPYPFVWNGSMYVPYISSLASVEASQWDKVCSLLYRVKKIETTCCTPNCDNITIGFTPTYNADDNIFTLVFDKASGTEIPEDYEDCGSTLTAIDKFNNKVSIDIELSQDVAIELDTSTLDLSQTVNVSIKSCLSNGTLTCKTCYSQSLPIIEKCGLCKICAVDNSDSGKETVTVYYTLASSPNTVQTSTLYGGQCLTFSLPEDYPTVKSIITSSANITIENDPEYPCNDVAIPAPVADTCWFFEVPVTDTYTQIALKSTDSILANQTRLDFDFVESTIFRETYNTYIDYTNTNGSSISGEIITAATFNNDNAYAGIGLPQNLPQNVTLMTPSCNSAFHKTWDIKGQGGDYIVTFQSSNNGGTVVVSQFSAGTFKLKYNITQDQNNPDRWGFILKVQGQPTNINGIQKPEIAIKHPINGALTWIKGELLADDCQCPS